MENNSIVQSIIAAGKGLAIFAMISAGLVALTFLITEDKIIENERLALLHNLHELVPERLHDNDLYTDNISIDAPTLNYRGKAITVYRARMSEQPVSAIFSVIAPDGYSGAIKLLVAINHDKSVAGVRVVSHKETPGLGDAIDIQKSDWIKAFDSKSFENVKFSDWKVKKDGGHFDQLTGATITPRAIVNITKKTLKYFTENKQAIFKTEITHLESNNGNS